MKLEALTGGVLQSAFNNFAKFTVKHLRWSLFLIKLQAWWCVTLSREKTLAHVFTVSLLFNKTYFVEHARCLSDMNQKNCIHKIYFRKTTAMASFLMQLQSCRLTVFQNGLHRRYFPMKIGKFCKTSILRNNAARLLLISCDTFNVLPALPVTNQFSHSMEIWY